VGEEGVGHVLVEERGWADEVEGYSVWAVLCLHISIVPYPPWMLMVELQGYGNGEEIRTFS